jgi:hypothetical protein
VTVAVQQRVVGADGVTNGGYDEAFLLTVAGECNDDEDEMDTGGGSRRRENQRSGRYRSGRC